MKRAYEQHEAQNLRPLIESIARELEDRFTAVRRLERRLRRFERRGGDETSRVATVAELAEHRRNVRHATAEIEALGAELERQRPVVIRLPGPDGTFAGGYRMSATGDVPAAEQTA